MRALKLNGRGQIAVEQVDTPSPGPGEVLVKVAGAGLCHSDLHVVYEADFPVKNLTLGHETAGTVAELGNGVAGFETGDPVLVYLVWACGTCRACVQGRDNACMKTVARTVPPPCPGLGPDGGMADYIKVPARFLEPLGDLDPKESGPLADAGLTPMHAINGARHRLTPGSTAVVIGAGGLGHVGIQILKATCAARVIAVDISEEKLKLAQECGADELVHADAGALAQVRALVDGYGADAVFDFVGTQPTVELAADMVAPDGALRIVGVAGGGFSYPGPTGAGLPFGVDLRHSYGGTRQDQRMVIDLARAGLVRPRVSYYPLDEGTAAFADLRAGRVAGRAVLVP
jgi:propanol-preferring alcohol dehydrogenase